MISKITIPVHEGVLLRKVVRGGYWLFFTPLIKLLRHFRTVESSSMESRGPGDDVQNKFEGKNHSGDKVTTPGSWKSSSQPGFLHDFPYKWAAIYNGKCQFRTRFSTSNFVPRVTFSFKFVLNIISRSSTFHRTRFHGPKVSQ